jgi:DNA excision repair protein ERCC-5
LLLPIISKASKRGQAAALNRQGNLNDFFDVSSGSGTAVPKKAQAYASKRLQQIVSDFRKQQKDTGQVDSSTPGTSEDDTEETGEVEKPSKKRKRTKKDGGNVAGTKKSARGRGRGRGKGGAVRGGRGKQAETSSATVADSDSADDTTFKDVDVVPDRPLEKTLRPRPKPRPVGKAAQQRTTNPDDSEE